MADFVLDCDGLSNLTKQRMERNESERHVVNAATEELAPIFGQELQNAMGQYVLSQFINKVGS